jgi:signal transduction histidine kinase
MACCHSTRPEGLESRTSNGEHLGRPLDVTGLGLPVVRTILQEYGGDLTVESRPGEGSVFTFRLPLALRPS